MLKKLIRTDTNEIVGTYETYYEADLQAMIKHNEIFGRTGKKVRFKIELEIEGK